MHILRKYPFSLICVALIWMLCFDTTEGMPNVSIPNIDKLVHFAMYFGTCSTIWWERLKATGREDVRWLACFAIIAPILMSGVIEILQSQTSTPLAHGQIDISFLFAQHIHSDILWKRAIFPQSLPSEYLTLASALRATNYAANRSLLSPPGNCAKSFRCCKICVKP